MLFTAPYSSPLLSGLIALFAVTTLQDCWSSHSSITADGAPFA